MKLASFAIALVAAAATAALAAPTGGAEAGAEAPPPGIVPASVTLRDVLERNANAVGTPRPDKAVREVWAYQRADVQGHETTYSIGDDFRTDLTLGKTHESRGRYHGKDWFQSYNGYTVVSTGLHRRDELADRALSAATSAPAGVTLLGESADPAAFVVKVAPPGGRVEYRFYDTTTYLLVRRERAVEGRRIVIRYDDFRPTLGRTLPWHEVDTDGRQFNEEERTREAISLEPPDEARVQIPPDARSPLSLAAPKVSLPAQIIADRIIVTVEMAGHKVNLQLDSGASGILLDRSIADALKFESFGKSTEATAGAYTATRTLVPRMDIGGATLSDIEVETAPFVQYTNGTPVAGLLGFDFIAGCVVRIDYQNKTVDAIDPGTFVAPAGAIRVPIRLDDAVPAVLADVGGAEAPGFIVDTGADRSMLFTDFVAAHPLETSDRGLGAAMLTSFPFIGNISGVGGEVKVRPVQVASLGLASISLPNWLFLAISTEARSFEGEDFDGLLGQDVLRNFTLYLDYRHAAIYLEPNARFHQRWG